MCTKAGCQEITIEKINVVTVEEISFECYLTLQCIYKILQNANNTFFLKKKGIMFFFCKAQLTLCEILKACLFTCYSQRLSLGGYLF